MSTLKSVVLEFGENYVRGGLSGENAPRFTVEFVGLTATTSTHPSLRIRLNELFQKVFVKFLQIKPKICDVLVVEKFLVSSDLRDHIISVLLRDCQVHSVSMQPDLLMGALSSCASSGVIVNIGTQSCQVICFVKGRPMIHTLKETTVGTAHAEFAFNSDLNALLEKTVPPKDSAELFRRIVCCSNTAPSAGTEASVEDAVVAPMQNVSNVTFTVSGEIRSACLMGLITGFAGDGECVDENGGVVGMLLESLKACNHDVRHLAAASIIIMGTGADIPGLADAICRTATTMAASRPEYAQSLHSVVLNKLPEQRLRCMSTAFPRPSLAWVGGSLFASLKENKAAYVTLQDLVQRGKYAATTAVTSGEKDPYLLSAPDWQSLSASDWAFCRANTAAGVVTATM